MRRAVAFALVAAAVAIAAVAFLLRSHLAKPRNVILISIDTLRQDRLGAYGYGRATTPHLDALAARGVLFENATAPSSWTVPSHVSLFTGLYPHTHGATGQAQSMSPSAVPLASWLFSFGYDTGGVVNASLLGPSRGFARGFESFEVVRRPLPEPAAPLVDEQALAWLDPPRDRPFFLFVHHYDVHSGYAPQEQYRKMFVRPYDGIATGATASLKAARFGRLDLGPADAQFLSDLSTTPRSARSTTSWAASSRNSNAADTPRARSSFSPPTTARSSSSTADSSTPGRCTRNWCRCRC